MTCDFLFFQHCYLAYCVTSSRSVQEPVENPHLTAYCSMRCSSLPWRHLRQFMSGSLRGGASQIQQTSSTPAATDENRQTEEERGGGGLSKGNVSKSWHSFMYIDSHHLIDFSVPCTLSDHTGPNKRPTSPSFDVRWCGGGGGVWGQNFPEESLV